MSVLELTSRVESLAKSPDSQELLQALTAVYGEGLNRIAAAIRDSPDGERILDTLCGDPFVASLLIVHDLHPIPLEMRIERALDKVRPYIHSHAGKVELVNIEGGVVELRLSGTCDGCPASSATMKLNIEREIMQIAPEILEVRSIA